MEPKRGKEIMAKRNIFQEAMEGVAAMKDHRKGKLTLRSYKVDPAPLPRADSKLIEAIRQGLKDVEEGRVHDARQALELLRPRLGLSLRINTESSGKGKK